MSDVPVLPTTFCKLDDFDLWSDGPRYIHTPTWEHWFNDRKAKSEIRWVFNRRNRRLAFMQVLDECSRAWIDGTPEEASEVELDLTESDGRFLEDLEEWRLLEANSLPSWTAKASKQDKHPLVPRDDLPLAKAESEDLPTHQAHSNVYWLSDYRRASGSS